MEILNCFARLEHSVIKIQNVFYCFKIRFRRFLLSRFWELFFYVWEKFLDLENFPKFSFRIFFFSKFEFFGIEYEVFGYAEWNGTNLSSMKIFYKSQIVPSEQFDGCCFLVWTNCSFRSSLSPWLPESKKLGIPAGHGVHLNTAKKEDTIFAW